MLDPSRVRTLWAEERGPVAAVVVVRCAKTFRAIEGRDRVLMLAGQSFIALVPLLIVSASLTSASGVTQVGERLIDRLELSGSAAEGVRILFAYPPGAAGGVTLFSCLLLLVSLNGLAGSVQRTFEGCWGLPRAGARRAGSRAAGFAVILAAILAAGWVGRVADDWPLHLVLGPALQLAALVAAWTLGTFLLLSRRRPWRDLVVGAAVSAVVQLAAGWATAIWLPGQFERFAERYGVIGVALALVTWLIAVAAVIVGGAVVGGVLGRTTPTTARADPDRSRA